MRRFGITLACLIGVAALGGCAVINGATLGGVAGGAIGAVVSGGPGSCPASWSVAR